MAKSRWFRVSKSSMEMYHRCPRQWFYSRKMPGKTDYRRLCGTEVHRFVPQLHKRSTESRPFFYKTKRSALNVWFFRWQKALADNQGKIILANTEEAKKFGNIGAGCISRYWDDNLDLPRPLQIEKMYRWKIFGVPIVGVVDQVRSMPLDFIAKKRPELLENGQLISGYDPVAIIDLKTEYLGNGYQAENSSEEKARIQYHLHEGLEAMIYTYLYEMNTRKKPIGFILYSLSLGKYFFTYRTEAHLEDFMYRVKSFLDSVSAQVFPKRTGKHCLYCDYMEECSAGIFFQEEGSTDRFFQMSNPDAMEHFQDTSPNEMFPNPKEAIKEKQLSFKFNNKRRKMELPIQLELCENQVPKIGKE